MEIELLKHILPQEFVEYFDLVDIQSMDNQLILQLDEKPVKPPEHIDKNLESKGFRAAIYLHDFPIRDRQVLLKVRRRKWQDIATGNVYSRDWGLKQEGTSYTKEFAAFLKKMLGHQSGKC